MFASAVFDEESWKLTVDGKPVAVEAKPLDLLHELLLRAGKVVSKEELLDAVWPEVVVVEASLTTAVLKLRRALGDNRRDSRIIKVVPRIGYMLNVPVEVQYAQGAAQPTKQVDVPIPATGAPPPATRLAPWRVRSLGAMAALTVAGLSLFAYVGLSAPPRRYTQVDARNALRELDVPTIKKLLASGWNPSVPFDDQGNDALKILLQACEWDPGHDQRKMLLMARTLNEAGDRFETRNVWGDTAYSIAKAPRYCGPDHPVTRMIRTQCYAGYKPPGDACLATYELERRSS